MNVRYSKFIKLILFTGDILLLNLSFLLGHFFRFGELSRIHKPEYIQLLLFINLLWFVAGHLINLYENFRVINLERVFGRLFKGILLHILLVFALIFMIKGHYYSREQLLFTYASFIVLISVWRALFLYIIRLYRLSGYNFRRIIIIGAGPVGRQFLRQLERHAEYGYKFMGFFDDNPGKNVDSRLVKGNIEDAKQFCIENKIDEIFCALPASSAPKIRELLEFSDKNMIRFKIVPDFRGLLNKQVKIDFYGFMPVLTVRNEPLESVYNRAIKRAFDIGFSLFVIIFFFTWMFPVIAILIKATSRGPVFFKQKRSGLKGEEFWCYKFRTMYVNNDADVKQATKDDPRITPIGRFLRRTSLDELPQFFNVLAGDMSVVGPRPHMIHHTKEYSKIIDKFMVRHLVKPGITGLAQIKGLRGETRNKLMMQKRVVADLWYIENWSFLLDLKIIVITIFNILRGEANAY